MHEDYSYISACSLNCRACPSYGRSCNGCLSNDRRQKRISKWACSIRVCCIEEHGLNNCSQCSEHQSCRIIHKLANSHTKDNRYFYRHVIPENLRKIREFGLKEYARHQEEIWRCPECGGTVAFYFYYCLDCGKKQDPESFPSSV